MVDDRGIVYTIEGITAGILMITTAYLILSTTSVYTPGDTHISDLQMEQLGNDVLAVMDTPMRDSQQSHLKTYLEADNGSAFRDEFLSLAKTKASFEHWAWQDNLKFNATVYFRKEGSGNIDWYPFSRSEVLTGSEHLVKATRRVLITDASTLSSNGADNRTQSVLLEVLIWRD